VRAHLSEGRHSCLVCRPAASFHRFGGAVWLGEIGAWQTIPACYLSSCVGSGVVLLGVTAMVRSDRAPRRCGTSKVFNGKCVMVRWDMGHGIHAGERWGLTLFFPPALQRRCQCVSPYGKSELSRELWRAGLVGLLVWRERVLCEADAPLVLVRIVVLVL